MDDTKLKTKIIKCLSTSISIILLAVLMSGCATMFSGTQQELQVKPVGAQLDIYSWDAKPFASAKAESDKPVTVHRPIGLHSYLVRLQKDGFCPRYWLTTPKANSVTYLNYIIGGLIGMAIDNSTGAGRSYSPTEFQVNILETQQCGS